MELAEIDEKLQTSHETDKLKFIKFVQHKCKAGEIDVKALLEKKSKSKNVKKSKKDKDVKQTEKSKDVKQTEKAELKKAKPEIPDADKTKIGQSAAQPPTSISSLDSKLTSEIYGTLQSTSIFSRLGKQKLSSLSTNKPPLVSLETTTEGELSDSSAYETRSKRRRSRSQSRSLSPDRTSRRRVNSGSCCSYHSRLGIVDLRCDSSSPDRRRRHHSERSGKRSRRSRSRSTSRHRSPIRFHSSSSTARRRRSRSKSSSSRSASPAMSPPRKMRIKDYRLDRPTLSNSSGMARAWGKALTQIKQDKMHSSQVHVEKKSVARTTSAPSKIETGTDAKRNVSKGPWIKPFTIASVKQKTAVSKPKVIPPAAQGLCEECVDQSADTADLRAAALQTLKSRAAKIVSSKDELLSSAEPAKDSKVPVSRNVTASLDKKVPCAEKKNQPQAVSESKEQPQGGAAQTSKVDTALSRTNPSRSVSDTLLKLNLVWKEVQSLSQEVQPQKVQPRLVSDIYEDSCSLNDSDIQVLSFDEDKAAAITKPAPTATKPTATITKAAATKQARTVTNPAATITKPVRSTKKPSATATNPASTIKKPAATITSSAAISTKPAATTKKPAATITKSSVSGPTDSKSSSGSSIATGPVKMGGDPIVPIHVTEDSEAPCSPTPPSSSPRSHPDYSLNFEELNVEDFVVLSELQESEISPVESHKSKDVSPPAEMSVSQRLVELSKEDHGSKAEEGNRKLKTRKIQADNKAALRKRMLLDSFKNVSAKCIIV